MKKLTRERVALTIFFGKDWFLADAATQLAAERLIFAKVCKRDSTILLSALGLSDHF